MSRLTVDELNVLEIGGGTASFSGLVEAVTGLAWTARVAYRFAMHGAAASTASGNTELQIYAYVDRRVPVLAKMYERKLRGYRAIGYGRSDESAL